MIRRVLIPFLCLVVFASCSSMPGAKYPLPENIGNIVLADVYDIQIDSVTTGMKSFTIGNRIYSPKKADQSIISIRYKIINTSTVPIEELQNKDFEVVYSLNENTKYEITESTFLLGDTNFNKVQDQKMIEPGKYQNLKIYYVADETAVIKAISYMRKDFIVVIAEPEPELTAFLQQLTKIEEFVVFAQLLSFEKLAEFSKRYNIPFDCKNKNGITPLLASVMKGNTDAVKGLLNAGVDVHTKIYYLFSEAEPIHVAAISGQIEVFDLLIKSGVDINQKNMDGDTPMAFAVRNNQLPMVKHLVTLGVDPKQVKIHMAWSGSITAFKYASTKGMPEMAAYFKSLGITE